MKKILIICYIWCLAAGLQAQTESLDFSLLKPVTTETTDTLIDVTSDDSLAVGLPWPENIVTRLDKLMKEPLLKKSQLG